MGDYVLDSRTLETAENLNWLALQIKEEEKIHEKAFVSL